MIRTILTVATSLTLAVSLSACSSSGGETIDGTSGSLTASAPAEDGKEPTVEISDMPFSVEETTVKVLKEGEGDTVPPRAVVDVDYYGVNGRTGESFDSSYSRNQSAQFPLDRVVEGFSKAIEGQKVGSDIVVAMPPKDGYGVDGQPSVGIEGTDTLVFFIHIKDIVSEGGAPPAQPEAPAEGAEGTEGDNATGGAEGGEAPPTPEGGETATE